jgi:7-carboxy-7-deazaguanine synthase
MKANVLEIFRSFQGEGKYVGASQVFVRLFECNMHCVWCDTPNSIGDGKREFTEMLIDDLYKDIIKLTKGCHSVSLTGGEPLIQKDVIKDLAKRLKDDGITTFLETNGVFPDALAEVIENIDIISMDIKLPSSTQCKEYWKEHKQFVEIASKKDLFIKTVITNNTDLEDIEKTIEVIKNVDPNILFILQPNYFEMKQGVMEKCLRFEEICSKKLNNVRIIPQVHKFMKLR